MMSSHIDTIMQQASESLVGMDYLTCESLCLEALQLARRDAHWAYYARILLPLQEARRQRRMIAAEGLLRLGTRTLTGKPTDWIEPISAGCLVVTSTDGAGIAQQIEDQARTQRKYIEVLLASPTGAADGRDGQEVWTLRSFRGPQVQCDVPAPPGQWVDRWLPVDPQAASAGAMPGVGGSDRGISGKNVWGGNVSGGDVSGGGLPVQGSQTPADWFIQATEKLGDAALAQVRSPLGELARVDELERCLQVVADHEILHQRLADAARAVALKASDRA